MTTRANVLRFFSVSYHWFCTKVASEAIYCYNSFSVFYHWFSAQVTAKAVMISRVSGRGMCGILAFVLFLRNWLWELAFFLNHFTSFNSNFVSLLFPFLLRTNLRCWNFVSWNSHMTWSAFTLFLGCRTEFAFNMGHFLIILPFHSLLTTFEVYISLIFDLFFKSLLWIKQIQGSVRVKIINEYVYAWSKFLFVLLVIFNFFPQINHFLLFYISTWGGKSLRSSWRLVEKFHISAFPTYYSLYNWTGEHEITKLKPCLHEQFLCDKYIW